MDISTLYFSSAVSRLSILMIFIVLAFSQHNKTYLLHWIVALSASSLGSAIEMHYTQHATLQIPIALLVYPLFFCSLSASWSGLRLFYNRKVSNSVLLSLTLLPSVIYVFPLSFELPQYIAMSFVYFTAAFLIGMILYEILRGKEKAIYSQYVVALAFSFYFFALIIPAVMIFLKMMPPKQNTSALSAMLFDQCASILIYFGYIAMAGERASLSLKKLAETDPLTNLTNRRGAHNVLEYYYKKSISGGSCSILIGDIDYFKSINDTLGHKAGDIVLIGIAEVMKSNLRKRDRAIRWGGEEFLIILPETSLEEAGVMAERLREQVEKSIFPCGNNKIKVTISIGVANIYSADTNYEITIARADAGLYQAKNIGRNCVCQI